jgi:hypothetical protein
LKFPDDSQVRVNGLVEIMTDLYAQGWPASDATAEEILDRLEAKKNYIPSSDLARREYAYVLLKEYRNYLKDRAESNPKR